MGGRYHRLGKAVPSKTARCGSTHALPPGTLLVPALALPSSHVTWLPLARPQCQPQPALPALPPSAGEDGTAPPSAGGANLGWGPVAALRGLWGPAGPWLKGLGFGQKGLASLSQRSTRRPWVEQCREHCSATAKPVLWISEGSLLPKLSEDTFYQPCASLQFLKE